MPKGIAKTKWDFSKKKGCKYERQTWCELPKRKRCDSCILLANGDKACEIKL